MTTSIPGQKARHAIIRERCRELLREEYLHVLDGWAPAQPDPPTPPPRPA